MLKAIKAKFKNSKGETLAETLVAIVLLSLVSVALAAMIGSSSNMNSSAKKYDEKLDRAVAAMESNDASALDGTATVTIGSDTVSFKIKMHTSGDDTMKLCAYDAAEANNA